MKRNFVVDLGEGLAKLASEHLKSPSSSMVFNPQKKTEKTQLFGEFLRISEMQKEIVKIALFQGRAAFEKVRKSKPLKE